MVTKPIVGWHIARVHPPCSEAPAERANNASRCNGHQELGPQGADKRTGKTKTPATSFPDIGDPGCAFVFTDAAREDGTGFGGLTLVRFDGRAPPTCLYMTELWPDGARKALQCDRVSMPAGEAFGAVALIDRVLGVLDDATQDVVCFTDSAATARGLTTGGSGSPQLNLILRWLFDRHPGVQFLGIHIPGVLNVASDNLSRGRPEKALADVRRTGAHLQRLRPGGDIMSALLERVMTAERRDDC